MELEEIKAILAQSYLDFKLTSAEKHLVISRFSKIQNDAEKLSYARNCAFDLVVTETRKSSENILRSLKWLKGIVKSIDQIQTDDCQLVQKAFFSPGKSCEKEIVKRIGNAKENIKVCVFTISNNHISRALMKAHKNGIKVRICTDNHKAGDLGSDIDEMSRKGIAVKVDLTDNHMHHKFAIFDDKILLNGSYNWTRSATEFNDENIVCSNDQELINQFGGQFEKLWDRCKNYSS